MPGAGLAHTALTTGYEAVEEALRNTNPQNVVQQLQHAFRTIVQMGADDLIVTAQTLHTMAAMNDSLKRHPVVISIANAVRQRMFHMVSTVRRNGADSISSDLRRRFESAWGMTIMSLDLPLRTL